MQINSRQELNEYISFHEDLKSQVQNKIKSLKNALSKHESDLIYHSININNFKQQLIQFDNAYPKQEESEYQKDIREFKERFKCLNLK